MTTLHVATVALKTGKYKLRRKYKLKRLQETTTTTTNKASIPNFLDQLHESFSSI